MRELKDYFCTYEQSKKLIKLGFEQDCAGDLYMGDNLIIGDRTFSSFDDRYINTICIAPLRSQALDFFRRKGLENGVTPFNNKGYWFFISRGKFEYISPNFTLYHEAESALIDKLIELETEAQHGS